MHFSYLNLYKMPNVVQYESYWNKGIQQNLHKIEKIVQSSCETTDFGP